MSIILPGTGTVQVAEILLEQKNLIRDKESKTFSFRTITATCRHEVFALANSLHNGGLTDMKAHNDYTVHLVTLHLMFNGPLSDHRK